MATLKEDLGELHQLIVAKEHALQTEFTKAQDLDAIIRTREETLDVETSKRTDLQVAIQKINTHLKAEQESVFGLDTCTDVNRGALSETQRKTVELSAKVDAWSSEVQEGMERRLCTIQGQMDELKAYGIEQKEKEAEAKVARLAARREREMEEAKAREMEEMKAAAHDNRIRVEEEIIQLRHRLEKATTKKAALAHRQRIASQELEDERRRTEDHLAKVQAAAKAAMHRKEKMEIALKKDREQFQDVIKAVEQEQEEITSLAKRVDEQRAANATKEIEKEERRNALQEKENKVLAQKLKIEELEKEKNSLLSQRAQEEKAKGEAEADAILSIYDPDWVERLDTYETELAAHKRLLEGRHHGMALEQRRLATTEKAVQRVKDEEDPSAMMAFAREAVDAVTEGPERLGTPVQEAVTRFAATFETWQEAMTTLRGREGGEEGGDLETDADSEGTRDEEEDTRMEAKEQELIQKRVALRDVLGLKDGEQLVEEYRQMRLQLDKELTTLRTALKEHKARATECEAAVAEFRARTETKEEELCRLGSIRKAREKALEKLLDASLARVRQETEQEVERRRYELETAYLEADRKYIRMDEEMKEKYAEELRIVMEQEEKLMCDKREQQGNEKKGEEQSRPRKSKAADNK